MAIDVDSFMRAPTWAKWLSVLAVVLLISGAFYSLVYSSLNEKLTAAQVSETQLNRDIETAERREKQFVKLTQELEARVEIDMQNRRVLPEDAEIPAFLQDLNRVAESSGLTIRVVEPHPEEQAQQYVKVPVRLEVSGRFHQVLKFFYNVSKLDRAISIENIRFKRASESNTGEVTLDASMLATTYRSPGAGGAQAGGRQ